MSDDITARARRRTGVIVAVAVLVLLVAGAAVAGLVVALGRRGTPVSQPAPAAVATTPAGHSSTGGSPLPGAAASSAVGGLSWTTVAGAKVPVSGTDGPRETANGRARGFTRTPMGAVLAAAHISLRLCPQVGPSVFEPTVTDQVVGPDQAALRQHLEDDYTTARAQLGVPYGDPAGQLYSTARGYRVSLTAEGADVVLLIEGPGQSGSVLIALSMHMRWVDGDWALLAPTGGDWNNAAQVTTDSSGYTQFPDGS